MVDFVSIRYTRNLFLRGMCVVYLFAFMSFYVQIPGLYGDNGILPARSLLENSKHKTLSDKIHYQPTLLWLAPYLGLDVGYMLDFLALLGTFLAFTGFVSQKFCTIPLFAGLWSLYFSIYQVGQVFVTKQWDNLLLESGFLCMFVAHIVPLGRKGRGSPKSYVSFWLVRWLLFRFLFTTGIVKLLSDCPKWWDLSAITYAFESSPLPTPLSWYMHHLPVWGLKLIGVVLLTCEIILPYLFFAPIRGIRITGFAIQIFLQTLIVLTGNFNFVNLLVVTLSFSLLDDYYFFGKPKKSQSTAANVMLGVINLFVHIAVIALVIHLFSIRVEGKEIVSKIAFRRDQFNDVVKEGLLITCYIGLISLGCRVARSVASALLDVNGFMNKFYALIGTVFYVAVAVLLFTASTVPLQSLHKTTNSSINPSLRVVYNRLSKMHTVNQYGLFTKTLGTQGRLEIVFEGSDSVEGPWQEYNFLYKPGNVNHSLPFVAPYSPRLDWQLFWAAQTTYQDQPWILSLTHRLLSGNQEVLALLDRNQPFKKPPKFVRASLYNYKFTSWEQRWQSAWWRREKVGEYFPAYTKDSPALTDYLKARNLLPVVKDKTVNDIWKSFLDAIRSVTNRLEATLLLWSVFTAGFAVIATGSR